MSFLDTTAEEDFTISDPEPSKRLKNNDGSSISTSTNVRNNIFVAEHKVSRMQRGVSHDIERKFRGCVAWFTGLSGAGKSTVSMGVEKELVSRGFQCYCLDGDNMRSGMNKGLGFSPEDRKENIRRTAETAVLMADAGFIVLCSLVSPYIEDRRNARKIVEEKQMKFYEIFVNTPLEECINRDTKGLYRRAISGQIADLTGMSPKSPYEEPRHPELSLDTVSNTIDKTVNYVIEFLVKQTVIPRNLPTLKSNGSTSGKVVELFVSSQYDIVNAKKSLVSLQITKDDLQWVQVLSEGWASPLSGFMKEDQYLQCLHFNCLKTNNTVVNQSIAIVLPIDNNQKAAIQDQSAIVLVYEGKDIAVLRNLEVYAHRKEERISRQFGSAHSDHPTVNKINNSGDWLVGGDLEVFERIKWNDGLDSYRKTPKELRQLYANLDADVVYAFQLRNPVHNGHALLMRDCERQLKTKGFKKPVLLLHPLGGWTKDDDVPLAVRIEQHKAVLDEGVLDPKATILAIFPSPMMYAGPTEVQWHAKARLVAGANYYIVGRDPAGIPHPDGSKQDLYEASHGGRVLAMAPGLDELNILKFKVASYDRTQQKMAFIDNKRKADFDHISGTKMRTLARDGMEPPQGFMGPKAWQVLAKHYQEHVNGAN